MSSHSVFEAIASGDRVALATLLEADPSLARARDERGVSALLVARYHMREDLVALLRGHAGALDVCEAAAVGDVERLRELVAVERRAVEERSADGFTPLHLACFFGHLEAARLLLDAGAPVDAVATNGTELRPLHGAAASRRAETVALLLERGADPDARQKGGYTALHAAAKHGDIAMARALVAAGASLDVRTDEGASAAQMLAADAPGELREVVGG